MGRGCVPCTVQGNAASTRAKVRPTVSGGDGRPGATAVFEVAQSAGNGTCDLCAQLSSTPVTELQRCRGCGIELKTRRGVCGACATPNDELCAACSAGTGTPIAVTTSSRVGSGGTVAVSPSSHAGGSAAAKLGSGLLRLGHAMSSVADVVEAGVDTPVADAVVDVVGMIPGVVDVAGQVVAGLLALADRFPLASQCGGVLNLKDLFAMYQVSQCRTHTRAHTRW